ncbi:ATP-grasp domain-containing protein [Streptomyces kanasensis]|uniref:ATP-grasp domain-containing protein n=1 Tax=Streptomyces kanasensis TaxID=936756 RepID=UPI00381B5C93
MTLVVLGADAAVARAAATLPVDVVHVRLPGAAPLDRGTYDPVGRGAPEHGAPTVAVPPHPSRSAVHPCRPATRPRRHVVQHSVDYQHAPTFLAFVDAVLRPLAPAAVVSLTELGLEPAAVAARHLGATGTPPEAVRATRDKLAMRRALHRAAPHLNPAFAAGDDPEAVARLFDGRPGTAVVAKPVAGTGSNAVTLVRTPVDLPADRRTPATLLERYVPGQEFSVETLSSGGRHTCLGIAEKRTAGEGFVELAHLMPAPSLDGPGSTRVERAVAELLDAVGLVDGPAHTEVKVHGDRVTVIETHNRPGGDGIADLVRLTRGVDWRRAALGWAVGEGPREEPGGPLAAAAATVFLTAPPGRVTAVAPRPRLAAGRLVGWDVEVEPGDPVSPLRSSADRLGMALLTAPSGAACAAAVDELTALPIVTTDRSEEDT